jgi:hypothetical protein
VSENDGYASCPLGQLDIQHFEVIVNLHVTRRRFSALLPDRASQVHQHGDKHKRSHNHTPRLASLTSLPPLKTLRSKTRASDRYHG